MSKLFTILLVFVFSLTLFASNPKIDGIFKKYDGKKGFTTVNVTKDMFGLFMQMDNSAEDNTSLKKSMSKLDGIKIMNYTADSTQNISKSLFSEIKKSIPMSEYKELMVINDNQSNVKMLVKKNGEIITDFLMLVGEKDEVVLINISGNINLEDLRNVSKSMNIKGMEGIKSIDN